jgi:hypothetical protein
LDIAFWAQIWGRVLGSPLPIKAWWTQAAAASSARYFYF